MEKEVDYILMIWADLDGRGNKPMRRFQQKQLFFPIWLLFFISVIFFSLFVYLILFTLGTEKITLGAMKARGANDAHSPIESRRETVLRFKIFFSIHLFFLSFLFSVIFLHL